MQLEENNHGKETVCWKSRVRRDQFRFGGIVFALRFCPHAEVIADRDSGRSKGFGFVEMGADQEAQAAITGLNGKEHDGRGLTVNEAKPREDRRGGGGGGGSRGSYGGGGGGGGRGGRY